MVIQNERLANILQTIFLECVRYLLCNGDVKPDHLKACLQCAIEGIATTQDRDQKYVVQYSLEDLLRYFAQSSTLMQAEVETLKQAMPAEEDEK